MIHMNSATALPDCGLISQVLATPPGPIVVPVQRHGHTPRDFEALTDAEVDPESTQAREWPTSCWCGAKTWHQMASCDAHYVAPAAAVRALAVQA